VGRIYLKSLQLISFLSFFVGFAIITFSYDFIQVFLGQQWLGMVRAMQVLTIWGIIRSLGATSGPLWQALGKPKWTTLTQIVQVIILGISVFPLTRLYGINGTAYSVVLSAVIPNLILWYLVSTLIKRPLLHILKQLIYPLLIGLISSIVLNQIRYGYFPDPGIIQFIFLCMIFSLTYLAISLTVDYCFSLKLKQNIFSLFSDIAFISKI
jgi:PST family polysaccharide transporter/lipopolysaccharide exporter